MTQHKPSHRIKWRDHHMTWPRNRHQDIKTLHFKAKHHHHGTAEGSFTAKKWFGHRAGRSPCAHSIGKFFLCYIVLFLLETSAPGLSGHYWYYDCIRIIFLWDFRMFDHFRYKQFWRSCLLRRSGTDTTEKSDTAIDNLRRGFMAVTGSTGSTQRALGTKCYGAKGYEASWMRILRQKNWKIAKNCAVASSIPILCLYKAAKSVAYWISWIRTIKAHTHKDPCFLASGKWSNPEAASTPGFTARCPH